MVSIFFQQSLKKQSVTWSGRAGDREDVAGLRAGDTRGNEKQEFDNRDGHSKTVPHPITA